MNKHFVRLVAAALIPTLISNPTLAAGFVGSSPYPLTISSKYGFVTDSFTAKSNHQPLVVLIQDLHANKGVQRNVAEILKSISRRLSQQKGNSHGNKNLTVFVEGASGPFDVSILRNVQNPWVKTEAVKLFLGEAKLTGSEVAAIESETPMHLWGIDDKDLYIRNLLAFADASIKSPAPHPKNPAWRNYYQIAQERNIPLALNTLNHLDLLSQTATPPAVVAVVLGGYHSEGITKFLKVQNISYEVVTPVVDQLGEEHIYVAQMRQLAQAARQNTLARVASLSLNPFVAFVKLFRTQEAPAALEALERTTPVTREPWYRRAISKVVAFYHSINEGSQRDIFSELIQLVHRVGPASALPTMVEQTPGPGRLPEQTFFTGSPGSTIRIELAHAEHLIDERKFGEAENILGTLYSGLDGSISRRGGMSAEQYLTRFAARITEVTGFTGNEVFPPEDVPHALNVIVGLIKKLPTGNNLLEDLGIDSETGLPKVFATLSKSLSVFAYGQPKIELHGSNAAELEKDLAIRFPELYRHLGSRLVLRHPNGSKVAEDYTFTGGSEIEILDTVGGGAPSEQTQSPQVSVPEPVLKEYGADVLTPHVLKNIGRIDQTLDGERRNLLKERETRRDGLGTYLKFLRPSLKFTDAGSVRKSAKQIREEDWRGVSVEGMGKLESQVAQGTGPADSLKKIAHALNALHEVKLQPGEAVGTGHMFDNEDASSRNKQGPLISLRNLKKAIHADPDYLQAEKEAGYTHNLAIHPLWIFRPSGLHLEDKFVDVNGKLTAQAYTDVEGFVANNWQELKKLGQDPVLYLPKIETVEETIFWDKVLRMVEAQNGMPLNTIKVFVLIERLTATYQLEEIVWGLRGRIVGINVGRYDYVNGYLDALFKVSKVFLPDWAYVKMNEAFLGAYVKRAARIANKRGILLIGGMAQQIIEKDTPQNKDANERAITKIIEDKTLEAEEGASGAWAASPRVLVVIRDVFKKYLKGKPNQVGRVLGPVLYDKKTENELKEPHQGQITEADIRGLINKELQLGASALTTGGAAGIYNLLQRLRLMDDLATGELGLRLIRERVDKKLKFTDGPRKGELITQALLQQIIEEEYLKVLAGENNAIKAPENFYQISKKILEMGLFSKDPTPWYADLVNVAIDKEDVQETVRALKIYFEIYEKEHRRPEVSEVNKRLAEEKAKSTPPATGGTSSQPENMQHALKQIPNQAVRNFVSDATQLTGAETLEMVDASDDERLLDEAVASGEGVRTNDGNFYFRSHPADTARSVERTFVSTNDPNDKGMYNNWTDPKDIRPVVEEKIKNSMQGKKMYVIPYLMGPEGSPFSQVGVQVTDSRYVAINMIRMAKVGKVAWKALGDSDNFVKGIHSTGDLDKIRRARPGHKDDDRYFVSFPQERLIMSFGSGYGGNALLGKKFHSLRQASYDARKEGWLAEHMLIAGVEDLEAPVDSPERIRYFAAAFPSASGKTNLAMMLPPDALGKRYKIWVVGDDIAWMRKGADGRLHAFNPENGMFGVVPETNEQTNPNAMASIGPNTKTIFTNVAFNPKTGEVWWEGKTKSHPSLEGDGQFWQDWMGQPIIKRSAEEKNKPWAQANSRYTTTMANAPNWLGHATSDHLKKDFNDPAGVPISAIFWGGRVSSDREPLIRQLRNAADGIYDGSVMGVEKTAAVEGKVGEFNEEPMAQQAFFSYNEVDYFKHFLDVMKDLGDKAPGFFHVNWFQKDADGKFRWPGYGENLRAILWALDRVAGKGDAVKTPAGYIPTVETLNRQELNVPRDTMDRLVHFNLDAWKAEAMRRTAFLQPMWEALSQELKAAHLYFLRRLIQHIDLPAKAFPKNKVDIERQKAGEAARKAAFEEEVKKVKEEWEKEDPYWKRERVYTAEEVVRLRNSKELREDHSWSKNTALKLRQWIKDAYQKKEIIQYYGVMSGQEAVDAVRAAHAAGVRPILYLSGWNTAASGNTNRRNFPDLALFDADSLVQNVLDIKHALQQAEQIDRLEGRFDIDWAAPMVVDIETGRGMVNEVYLLAKRVLEAGAAAIHIENQYNKKCGHMSFMTLVDTIIQVKRILAARLAADVLDIPAIVITRSDTMRAELIQDNIDPTDRPFLAWHKIKAGDNLNGEIVQEVEGRLYTKGKGYIRMSNLVPMKVDKDWKPLSSEQADMLNGEYIIKEEVAPGKFGPMKTSSIGPLFSKESDARIEAKALLMADSTMRVDEGLYFYEGGRKAAIAHGRVMARYGHVSWFETGSPDAVEASEIAKGIHEEFPDQPMKYNLSGNFNYANYADEDLISFEEVLAKHGYVMSFNTIINWWNRRQSALRFSTRFFLGNPTLALKQAQKEAQEAAALLDIKIKPQHDVGSPVYDSIGEILGSGVGAANAKGQSTEEQFEGDRTAGTHSLLANIFTGRLAPLNWAVRIVMIGGVVPHEFGHFFEALAMGRWEDLKKVRPWHFLSGMPFETRGISALFGLWGNGIVFMLAGLGWIHFHPGYLLIAGSITALVEALVAIPYFARNHPNADLINAKGVEREGSAA